jgi:hypothetical protein
MRNQLDGRIDERFDTLALHLQAFNQANQEHYAISCVAQDDGNSEQFSDARTLAAAIDAPARDWEFSVYGLFGDDSDARVVTIYDPESPPPSAPAFGERYYETEYRRISCLIPGDA